MKKIKILKPMLSSFKTPFYFSKGPFRILKKDDNTFQLVDLLVFNRLSHNKQKKKKKPIWKPLIK